MANIFVSYNRENEDKTRALVNDIQELGHTVWFDHDLSGGQVWWDTILETIRNCDVFVFVLSDGSLNSSACKLEYTYASELGKTILPVLIGEEVSTNLLPPILSKIQFVDYQKRDRDALLHLAKAFTTTPPSQPLPNPLPLPPKIPVSYLGSLAKQIESTSKLSYEAQSALLVDIKRGLHDPETATDTRTLLQKLRKQQHLFENIAREIDELLKNTMQVRMASHIPNAEYATLKQSEEQEITRRKVQKKKSFWTSLRVMIVGLTAIIAVVTGFYFAYPYIMTDKAYAFFKKANALHNLKQYDEAINAYNKAIAIDPEFAPALYYKGRVLLDLKRYDEAIASFDKAIAIKPSYDAALSEKEHTLWLRDHSHGKEPSDRAIAFLNKGIALYDLKQYDEAINAYNKAIAIDPEYANNFYNKGLALYKSGRYDEAITTLNKAIAINSNEFDNFYSKGLALYQLGRYDEAITTLNKAIAIDPDYPDVYYIKAYVYALANNKEKLLSNLEKAMKSSKYKKQMIKIDQTFKKYWNDKDFKKLVD